MESEPDCSMYGSGLFALIGLRFARLPGSTPLHFRRACFCLWLRILTVDGGALPSSKFSQFISTCVSFCVQQHRVYDKKFFKIFSSKISM